jgi:hypothetical protein
LIKIKNKEGPKIFVALVAEARATLRRDKKYLPHPKGEDIISHDLRIYNRKIVPD